jgi:hypothetical protein
MIYSPAFSGLPEPLKKRVLAQLGRALSGSEPEFSYLDGEERSVVQAILHETLPESQPYLTSPS